MFDKIYVLYFCIFCLVLQPERKSFINMKYFPTARLMRYKVTSPQPDRRVPQNNSLKIVNIIINTSPVTAGDARHSRAFGKCG